MYAPPKNHFTFLFGVYGFIMAFSLAIFIEEIFPFSHGHRHQKSGQNKHLEGPTPFTCQFNSHYEKHVHQELRYYGLG